MLLGLVLHGILSFSGIPIWPAMDVRSEPEVILPIMGWIHGFRMQLFFLVSGFFTAMMWKKRGGTALVTQRLLRIGIPLVAGAVILFPTMMVLGAWGGEVIAVRSLPLLLAVNRCKIYQGCLLIYLKTLFER